MSTVSDVIERSEFVFDESKKRAEGQFSGRQNFIRKTPWWIVSIIFHGAFMLLTMMIMVSETLPEDDITIFEMDVKKFVKPEYNEKLKRDIVKSNKVLDDEVMIENPVITKEDLPIDEIETPDNEDRLHKAKGRQEAISTIELGGTGWTGVFGVGGGGSGAYGWRDGGGKRRAVGKGGGSAATESAVDAALRWFNRHQAADGSWWFEKYWNECKDVPACEHINVEAYGKKSENGATGLALLCFLGAGHTTKAGKYRAQVVNGMSFLTRNQDQNGSFSPNNYVQGIAAMAVAECYGMTKSGDLKECAQKAADVLLSRQNGDGYLGWNYGAPKTRNDTSVSGWVVMGLKSAKSSGLDIGNAFEGAAQFIEKVTPKVRGDDYNPTMDNVHYTYMSDTGALGHQNTRLTAIGLLIRVFIGQNTKGMVLHAHANKLLEKIPGTGKKMDYYECYYATLAMFQMGGEYWKKWNEGMKKTLCDAQRMGGCADGSWDAGEGGGHITQRGGRLFNTAVGCLSLEVYYRYLPVAMIK